MSESWIFRFETEDLRTEYTLAVQTTLDILATVEDELLVKLSRLSPSEIEELRREVASALPIGNLPARLLKGLIKTRGQIVPLEKAQQDILSIFQECDRLTAQGLCPGFIAGPAAILYSYQGLLTLAGKDVDRVFPEGIWQFYLEFGLREDAARHVNEIVGYHRTIPKGAKELDILCSWVYQAIRTCFEYDDLLANEWTERVLARLVQDVLDGKDVGPGLSNLISDWVKIRPYSTGPNTHRDETYSQYRHRVFRAYFEERIHDLPSELQDIVWERLSALMETALPAYQRQMSILYTLQPGRYKESKAAIPLWQAQVALVVNGHYHLIDVCARDAQGHPLLFVEGLPDDRGKPLFPTEEGTLIDQVRRPVTVDRRGWAKLEKRERFLGRLRPPSAEKLKSRLAAILRYHQQPLSESSPVDVMLAVAPRSQQEELRARLSTKTRQEIEALKKAPIILNWDLRGDRQPLGEIRTGCRGIGDHALTIFRTKRSFVFDQAHIFFDGAWGLLLSQIMTEGALEAYEEFAALPEPLLSGDVGWKNLSRPLRLQSNPDFEMGAIGHLGRQDVAVENSEVDLLHFNRLRRWLKRQGIQMTVGDVLILYRSIYNPLYQPSSQVLEALGVFRARAANAREKKALRQIDHFLDSTKSSNPSLLIPMDASFIEPKERIFPTTFRTPFTKLFDLYRETCRACRVYQTEGGEEAETTFFAKRKELLSHLQVFTKMRAAIKALTIRRERSGGLNEVVKANEVFCNLGRVIKGSSLTRFTSARNDGLTKKLVWGVMSDDEGRLQLSLRDFRPHVEPLIGIGREDLARMLAQDYLTSFARGLNEFVRELCEVVAIPMH